MSTSTDAPPTASGPPDGPEDSADGASWLQQEMRRRMAERASGGGGRHARRDVGEPPRGVDYVPRHSIATPGPGADRPAPIGGTALPATDVPPAGPGWSGPERSPQDVPPVPRADPPPAPTEDVIGGPSRGPRPVPRAFRRTTRGLPSDKPAVFGGPRFTEPAPRQHHEPQEVDAFGGPGFGLPATRSDPDAPDLDDMPVRVTADALGLDLPEQVHRGAVTIATGPASDVVPPRAPARLLAAPPAESEVETTVRIDPVVEDEEGDDDGLAGAEDAEDTVLWSRDDLPDDTESIGPRSNRKLVVISEKKTRARAVRTVDSIQDGGAVGELLRSELIRAQLRVALGFALVAGLLLGLLPLAFALYPAIGRAEILGVRLPWVILGLAVYPVLFGLGWLHTRMAERVEHDFADRVQD